MTDKEFLKSNYFKFLLPLVAIWVIIVIIKRGYAFGQWLYAFMQ